MTNREMVLDSKIMYQVAAQFLMATHRCMKSEALGQRPAERLHIPEIVNLAFAVEVLLKGFLALESINYRNAKHNLYALYALIPDTHAAYLREQVEAEFDHFSERLKSVSTCFEDWRYVYERTSLTTKNYHFLFKLAHVAAGHLGNLVGFPALEPIRLVAPSPPEATKN